MKDYRVRHTFVDNLKRTIRRAPIDDDDLVEKSRERDQYVTNTLLFVSRGNNETASMRAVDCVLLQGIDP